MLATYLQLVAACAILGYCTYTDIKHREIGNIACLALLFVWLAYNVYLVFVRNYPIINVGFQLFEGFVVLGVMLIVSYLFEKFTGKASFGGGDIKLIAVCWLFFNLFSFLAFLFLSCLLGVVTSLFVEDKASGFPFAPAISLSFAAVYVGSNIFMLF